MIAKKVNYARPALFWKGIAFQNGRGVTRDLKRAYHYFSAAADLGYGVAAFNAGCYLETGTGTLRNDSQAAIRFRQAIEAEYAAAYYSLALCYLEGRGVTKSHRIAQELLCAGEKHGDPSCKYLLGRHDVLAGGAEARKGYDRVLKAANGGLGVAQAFLAECLLNGIGVRKNFRKAVEWFRLAARKGVPDAEYGLAWCYEEGIGIGQNLAAAIRWYKRAAEHRHAGACVALGRCYLMGIGVHTNPTMALKLYSLSAELGSPEGMFSLGTLLLEQRSAVTRRSGQKWLTAAATAGHLEAKKILRNSATGA